MTFRIEYQFDPGSLKKFFELLENNKPTIDENHDMYHVIEILEDEDIKDHMIKDAQNLISKYCQTSPEAEYFIENFRILDVNVFIAFLEKTVKEFEELLKTKGFSTLRPLLSEDGTKVFKIKIWNEGNRYRFSMILENFEKKEFEILLKNNFETHGF